MGKVVEQMLDAVVLGEADSLIETARPICRRDDVPQAYSALGQSLKPLLIFKQLKLLPNRRAE